MKMKRVFVSGPYSAENSIQVELNVRRICEAIGRLAKEGFAPSMLILGHYAPFGLDYEEWLKIALSEVSVCDCLLRVGGASPGADLEVARALEMGKRVYYSLEELLAEEGKEEPLSEEISKTPDVSRIRARSSIEIVEKPLEWRKEKPTEPGIYRLKSEEMKLSIGEDYSDEIVEIVNRSGDLICVGLENGADIPLKNVYDHFEWAGPFELRLI